MTKRTWVVLSGSSKRLVGNLDDDGAPVSYRIQVRIGQRWTNVGLPLQAERSDCDGMVYACRVYAQVAA